MNIRLLLVGVAALGAINLSAVESPRPKVTIENWDKGGAISHWGYTHVPEFFRAAIIMRGGAIVDLPVERKPEIGAFKMDGPSDTKITFDEFINNEAVDACIIVHAGKIVYEKYPTISPNDTHIIMS